MVKVKVPGSYWALGQIFHSCTPKTKTTFILSLPQYFRCLKQNSPLTHAHQVSSLFALLLWAEPVGFLLDQSRQNSPVETSVTPEGKKLDFNKAAQEDQHGCHHWNIHISPASQIQVCPSQSCTWENRKSLWKQNKTKTYKCLDCAISPRFYLLMLSLEK